MALTNIFFPYPIYYLILVLLAGIAVSALLYFRERRFSEQSKWLSRLLFLLRSLVVSAVFLLLLSPMLITNEERVQEPIVVLAQDNSESAVSNLTEEERINYLQSIETLTGVLEESYEVENVSFGENVTSAKVDTFNGRVSNLSQGISYIVENYADQNVGAVIFASDGIYNEGRNPIYETEGLTAPIYTIALGDTTRRTDLSIKNVFSNQLVYLGDEYEVQIDVRAFRGNGQNTRLSVQRVGETNQEFHSELISIGDDNYFQTINITVPANEVGVNRIRCSLSPINGEISRANNTRDIYVNVLDGRQKVLILANAPHPDLSAISQVITANKNYEADVKIYEDQDFDLQQYDQVIFHDLPSNSVDIRGDINALNKRRVPRLFIVGSQINTRRFNAVQDIIKITRAGNQNEFITPGLNSGFKKYSISDALRNGIGSFPPLVAPFGEYEIQSNASVALYQEIKDIETQYPLLAFLERDGIKNAVLIGEGYWKWRLYDFLENDNYILSSEIIDKPIQFISNKKDNRKFIVASAKRIFRENESILFTGQLYNDNYELINEPEVFLSVYGKNGQEYQFVMNRDGGFYSLDAGLLSPGSYTYQARTNFAGKEFKDEGRFSVQAIQLESYDLEAKHDVLYSLSEQSGGELFFPNQLDELGKHLTESDGIKPIIYQNIKNNPLINVKWLFWILFLGLGLEWVLRRYFGSY